MKKSTVFRIAFAGGGTGGHLAPGIALAEEFLYTAPCDVEFLIVGKDVETKIIITTTTTETKTTTPPKENGPVTFTPRPPA